MTLTSGKHADEVRQMWQCRALSEAEPKMQRVLLAAIRAEYPADLIIILKTTFGTLEIPTPFYRGYAFISPGGHVCCEVVDRDPSGLVWRGPVKVYDNENKFLYETRKLADKMKLNDADRMDMFYVLKKWISHDQRLDINDEKVA